MQYNKTSIHVARVNVKSLAAEAIIIKKEMGRASELDRCILYNHKVNVVKKEARLANLALAFLRGRPYKSCEITSKPFNIDRLTKKINKFARPWSHSKCVAYTVEDIVNWMQS